MSRKQHPTRSFEKIFEQANIVGPDNVILNDAEVGIVLAGGRAPLAAGTIANRRWKGTFNAPHQRGTHNTVEYRLSDVLEDRDRRIRRSA
jgi:hypothetical protein